MNPKRTDPRRGEVWLANLDPTVGAEIQKRRPVVVVSSDAVRALALRTVVPCTTSKILPAPWHVPIRGTLGNGLDRDTLADAAQVRTLACERFDHRLGRLAESTVDEIVAGIALLIEFV
jgi:mRNA interferase MazF